MRLIYTHQSLFTGLEEYSCIHAYEKSRYKGEAVASEEAALSLMNSVRSEDQQV